MFVRLVSNHLMPEVYPSFREPLLILLTCHLRTGITARLSIYKIYKYYQKSLLFLYRKGLLNRSKSDLETMLTVIQSKKFDIDEIRNSLQMLKEIISAFPVENDLEMISKLKTKKNMKVPIYKQILRLKEFINKHAENMFRRIS